MERGLIETAADEWRKKMREEGNKRARKARRKGQRKVGRNSL